MVDLLVLADDFTGALDTGVQFACRSIPTLVSTRIETLDQGKEGEISVIALDLETRHLAPADAASLVRQAVRKALQVGVQALYKKTDSTLRGNIGSELAAALEASGRPILPFVPAYPKNQRTTIAGCQYVDGVPLHLSVYAEDPQNPVRSSYVPEIIAEQSATATEVVGNANELQSAGRDQGTGRILVIDARRDSDLRIVAEQLKRLGLLRVTAGSAGFAGHLAQVLKLKRGGIERSRCPSQLLFVCGSTNPVALGQIEAAVKNGVKRILLEPGEVLNQAGREKEGVGNSSLLSRILGLLANGGDLILQTARGEEDVRRFHHYAGSTGVRAAAVPQLAAQGLTGLTGRILRSHGKLTPAVFGGDTTLALVQSLGLPKVFPIEQIRSGIVVSRMVADSMDIPLISKAGGFAASAIVQEIQRYVR